MQVQEVCAVPGLVVTPSEGVVPSGGKTALQVHFNPESPIKFDTRIEASVENFGLEQILFLHIHFKISSDFYSPERSF